MAVDEQNELPEATLREAELRRQLDGIQSQVTELNRARIEVAENPELYSEVQSLKEKFDEPSKQLEQSAEKLSQLVSENLTLRDENQALNTASNKKRRFRAKIRLMPTLETPNSRTGTTLPPTTSQRDAVTHEKTNGAEPDKEAPEGAEKMSLLWLLTWSRCSHGRKAPRGSSPHPEEQPRRLRLYSFHG